MKYLEMKKRAFMSIVNAVKGFVRTISGTPPLTLPDCVDNDSLISYSISGNSVQNGEPTSKNPIEIESVGELTNRNLFNPEEVIAKFQSGYTYKSGSYTCTSFRLKPNTTYYMKAFNPTAAVNTGGRFFISKNEAVNSGISQTISVIDESTHAYPRRYEKSATTDDTGLMYIGYYCVGKNAERDRMLRENQIQIVEGTYTAATAPEYEPYGKYKISILYGQGLEYIQYKSGYFINSSGVETATVGYKYTEDYIPVLPNTTYRIVFNIGISAGYYLTVPCYNENKDFLSRISLGAFDVSPKIGEFTTPENCHYIRYNMSINIRDVFLYNLNDTTTLYLDEPLRKVGDYADFIDGEKEKVVRNIKNVDITNLSWTKYSTSNTYYNMTFVDAKYDSNVYCLSDKYIGGKSGGGTSHGSGHIWFQSNTYTRLYISDDRFTDRDSFVQHMTELVANGTPINLTYVRNEAIEEDIELPKLPTIKGGTTIYSIETTVQPSNMSATYYATSKE